MGNVIRLEGLALSFGDLQVLSDISLAVAEGETVVLIGPSGCGKSTLLRVIAGIIPNMIKATLSGEVEVAGRLDMMFQESSLLPWRTLLSNVKLGLELQRMKQEPGRAEALLREVGLAGFEGTLPRHLSGGMRQRADLVSTLLTSPEVLLMDEPFGALDALTREEMWGVLETVRSLQEKVPASLLVTHSIEEAVVLANRVLVMRAHPGTIAAEIRVDVAHPRYHEGVLSPECFEIANEIRSSIRRLPDEEQ